MKRHVTDLGAAIAIWLGALLLSPHATAADIIGRAYDLGTGDFLYSERHSCDADRISCNVLYLDADGVLIARKQVDYSRSAHSPSLTLEDLRLAREARLEPEADPELVVDAGFDNYVRLRWEELAAGGTVAFPFQIVGRERPLAMKAQRQQSTDCSEQELCLEVGLDSWLLGMLVDPIQLTYQRDSRRLLRFRGISNLKDERGRSQFVDIRYSYLAEEGDTLVAQRDEDELVEGQPPVLAD